MNPASGAFQHRTQHRTKPIETFAWHSNGDTVAIERQFVCCNKIEISLALQRPALTRAFYSSPALEGFRSIDGVIVATASIGAHIDRITTGEMIDRFLPLLKEMSVAAKFPVSL